MMTAYDTVLKKAERQLLPAEIREKIPALYSQEDVKDKQAVAKFFLANWTWYVVEGSPVDADGVMQEKADDNTEDFLFFGLVEGFEREFGYFSLSELVNVQGPLGLKVERDEWFKPKSVDNL